jgi:hypothetical protein
MTCNGTEIFFDKMFSKGGGKNAENLKEGKRNHCTYGKKVCSFGSKYSMCMVELSAQRAGERKKTA